VGADRLDLKHLFKSRKQATEHDVSEAQLTKRQDSRWRRSNSALVTTLSELKAINAPAVAGLKATPSVGSNNPAATGIPSVL
jgi:hypothetical protein